MTRVPTVEFELFTSSFCGACAQTRAVLNRAIRHIPGGAVVSEHDIAFEPDRAESAGIRVTPTVIVRDADGTEVLRASGIPTIPQVLTAAVRAFDRKENHS